jgi:hypothetical protein
MSNEKSNMLILLLIDKLLKEKKTCFSLIISKNMVKAIIISFPTINEVILFS